MINWFDVVLGVDRADSVEDAARRSSRQFVRSVDHLAVAREDTSASGHHLTAWEALQAFGPEVLLAAYDYGSAVLPTVPNAAGRAIKRRREDLGLDMSVLSRAARVDSEELKAFEEHRALLPVATLERLAIVLGLDDHRIGVDESAGADTDLAVRLRSLRSGGQGAIALTNAAVLTFAEAAWTIETQYRLRGWLGLGNRLADFASSSDYGGPMNRAWSVGYLLAERARTTLGLGVTPIESMRRLVEQVIGIPILQVELPQWISGATVVSDEHRGIVLNTKGATQNVLIRRATLAHELGHLLYDPASALQNLRVDSERDIVAAADTLGDYVEQRANAFAIAFLAPPEAVRMLVQPPFDVEDVRRVMREFGIGPAAARFHIGNSHYNAYEVPSEPPNAWPSDEVRAQEDFTLDYFTPETTPPQRRGLFAGLVVAALDDHLISGDTAAMYLGSSSADLPASVGFIRDVYPVELRRPRM